MYSCCPVENTHGRQRFNMGALTRLGVPNEAKHDTMTF